MAYLVIAGIVALAILFVKFWTWFNITNDPFVTAHKVLEDDDKSTNPKIPRPDTYGNVGQLDTTNLARKMMRIIGME